MTAFFDHIQNSSREKKANEKAIIPLIMTLALAAASCGNNVAALDDVEELLIQDESEESDISADQTDAETDEDTAPQEPFVSTLTDEGRIFTQNDRDAIGFMSGDFYGQPVNDEDEALEAIYSMISDVGGDEDTELRYDLSGNEYRNTWPEAGTGKVAASLSPGSYYVYLKVDDKYADEGDPGTYYLYHPDTGWEEVSADVIQNYDFEQMTEPVDAAGGEKLLLLTDGLPE